MQSLPLLDALKVSLDLGNTLEADTGGNLTKAQAVSLFAELVKYRSCWFNNATVAATGTEGSNDRRAAFDPFILAEPLV